MTRNRLSFFLFIPMALLTGCAVMPTGPHVVVMPGEGISFEQFQADDRTCRAFAERSLEVNINDAGADNVVAGAVTGAVLGAATGALLGGHHGAAAGAGVGLVAGSAMGAGNAQVVQADAQQSYDIAYEQCMYAKDHQLPSARRDNRRARYYDAEPRYERAPRRVIIEDSEEPEYPAY
jgi:uncharacterized protein YcfJ